MVKITFSPAHELIVHEVVELGRDELLRERITPAGNMPLYWCDGILFSFSSLPMTDEVVRDYMSGRIHWLEVHYTRMPKHADVLTFDAEEYKSTVSIRVIDTSASQLHREFIKWMKANVK